MNFCPSPKTPFRTYNGKLWQTLDFLCGVGYNENAVKPRIRSFYYELFRFKRTSSRRNGRLHGPGRTDGEGFRQPGANLVLVARRQNLLDENKKEIEKEYGVKVLAHACDITDTEKVKAMVAAAMKEFGRIDILVNNAGTGAVAPAVDITDEQFNNELKIDLFGTFICAREIAKEMIKAKYGRIINIASMYGLVGNMAATCSPYHAAKGGVVNLTRALAAEWGKEDYRQQHLPGIFLDAADEGYFGNRLVCRLCEKRYPARKIRQGRRARYLRALPRVEIFFLCQRPEYRRGRRLYRHIT